MTRFLRESLRAAVALLFLLPLLWMTTAAFYPTGTPVPTALTLWPAEPTGANFSRVFTLVPLGRYTLNSLLVVALALPLTLVSSSWAGLAIALLPRRAQRRWVLLSLAALMVPGIALWATRFLIYRHLGLIDTVWALVAPAWMGTSPFFVLMYYRAFRRLPQALYDAAVLDGATIWQLWWRLALPLALPTTLAVAFLTFVFYWGDFLNPLLYLDSPSNYTLPVALQLLQQYDQSDWPLLMAAALWALLIPLALFMLVQILFYRRLNAQERS